MQSPSAPQRRSKRPDYNLIHARPLPLTITPYPPLIPHNPLSILHILYTFFFARPSCLPDPIYVATFHPETRCVHVTDTQSILALWNDGFFGKGSLSRSEPTWLSREKRALGILGKDEDLTAEEWTERRRQQRKEFKLERARAEKERIQKQLEHEGKIQNATSNPDSPVPNEVKHDIASESDPLSQLVAETVVEEEKGHKDVMPEIVSVENLEHLQLTPEEAFFLVYGLGSLEITDSVSNVSHQFSSPCTSFILGSRLV